MTDTYRFCPHCANPLTSRAEKDREPERPTCDRCGFIHYLDPKVAVGTIIHMANDDIVLARRAIEPGYGLWVFPGGYIDRGERLEDGARREALEECGLEVEIEGLINVYSYCGRTPIVVVYAARAVSGTLYAADHESLEVRAFAPSDIPWGSLAFDSTTQALGEYLRLGIRGWGLGIGERPRSARIETDD